MINSSRLQEPQKNDFFLNFIQQCASIGTWEYNIKNHSVVWSDETRKIHEVPLDYKPAVETGIEFYKKGYSQNTIKTLFNDCIIHKKNYDVELQIITAKGNERWVRAIGKPIIENNECTKIVGLFQDIHEKTIRSISLANKQEELKKTFDEALVGMASLDLKGNWLEINKSLCQIIGYNKSDLLKLTFLDITHPEDLDNGQKAYLDMLEGKTDSYKTEKRYIKKDGSIIYCLQSSFILRNNQGAPLHFIAQIQDITQIKNNTKKIISLLETTENQNERLLNFAHIVSHNLRSHSGNLRMLLDIYNTDMPENTKNEVYPLLEHAVDQLGETVENLNEVASINGKKEISSEPIYLLQSFERALATINANLIESNAKINIDIDSSFQVMGLPAYLDSILLNFLTNAVKYRQSNIELKIDIKAKIEHEFVVIKIKDNGLGIDLKKHGQKLFGMYKTFHKHKDSRGIGLFITKNQIESIGGKIKVKSEINKGTTFYIYLKHFSEN